MRGREGIDEMVATSKREGRKGSKHTGGLIV